LIVRPEVAAGVGIGAANLLPIGITRGDARLYLKLCERPPRGVLISQGGWPRRAFLDGRCSNSLTGNVILAPIDGGAFRDNSVWVRPRQATLARLAHFI
jgi:hypothetical protein